MSNDKIKINIFSDEESLECFNQQLQFFNNKKEDLTKMCFFFKNYSYYLDERLISIDKLIKLLPKEGNSTYYNLIDLFKEYFIKERTLLLQTNNMIKVDIIEKYDTKTNKMNEKIKFLISRINNKNEQHQKIIQKLQLSQEEYLQKANETTIQLQKFLETEANPKSSSGQKEKQKKKLKNLQDDLDKKILEFSALIKSSESSRIDYINIKQENVNEFKSIGNDAIDLMQSNIVFFISQLLSSNTTIKEIMEKIIQNGEKIVNKESDLSYLEEKRKTIADSPKKFDVIKFNKDIIFTDDIKNNAKINKEEIKNKLIDYINSINNRIFE